MKVIGPIEYDSDESVAEQADELSRLFGIDLEDCDRIDIAEHNIRFNLMRGDATAVLYVVIL